MSFTFTIPSDGKVSIQGYTDTMVSALVIPDNDGLGNIVDGIADGAFSILFTSLESVTFPNTIVKIGNGSFLNCRLLTGITFPGSLVEIGRSAFLGCSAISSLTFPAGVSLIDDSAFLSCRNLASVTFLGGPPTFGTDVFLNTLVTSINAPCYFRWPTELSILGQGENPTNTYSVILSDVITICLHQQELHF
jgi:hypothetical protein